MFSSKKSIKIDKQLYQRLQDKAAQAGYSSAEELIVHTLEAAVADQDDQLDREQAERQLRGLGYIE
jgi:metal-responsive CopG/Arc/MetJ family transcriptional regulator